MGEYQFKVEVSDREDKYLMEAYLTISHTPNNSEGHELDRESILGFLKTYHIVHGIQESVIDRIIEEKIMVEKAIVALGTAPTPGLDTRFEILVPDEIFEYEKFTSPEILELDTFEFPDYQIPTIPAQTPLMRKHPPEPGKPGINVFGKETGTPPMGKVRNFPKFRNADISHADQSVLISTLEGYPFITPHYISVEPVHVVSKDIVRPTEAEGEKDAVPTVNFDGIVMIRGSIMDQVRLVATSDVIILGATEAVVVESGRNVIISGGVTGKEMAVIKSQGDIISRFVEMCTLESGGDVHAKNIIQSFVISLGHVYADRILGGEVRGTGAIAANIIGSEGVDTAIMVGNNPYLEEKLEKTGEELMEMRSQLKEKMAAIAHMVFSEKRANDNPELAELRSKIPGIEFKIQQLYDREEQLTSYQKETPNATVVAYDTAYAGTMILFGEDHEYMVEEDETEMSYALGKYGIVRQSLNAPEEEDINENPDIIVEENEAE